MKIKETTDRTVLKYLSVLKDLKEEIENYPYLSVTKFMNDNRVSTKLGTVLSKNGVIVNNGGTKYPQWTWNSINPNVYMAKKCLKELRAIERKPRPKRRLDKKERDIAKNSVQVNQCLEYLEILSAKTKKGSVFSIVKFTKDFKMLPLFIYNTVLDLGYLKNEGGRYQPYYKWGKTPTSYSMAKEVLKAYKENNSNSPKEKEPSNKQAETMKDIKPNVIKFDSKIYEPLKRLKRTIDLTPNFSLYKFTQQEGLGDEFIQSVQDMGLIRNKGNDKNPNWEWTSRNNPSEEMVNDLISFMENTNQGASKDVKEVVLFWGLIKIRIS